LCDGACVTPVGQLEEDVEVDILTVEPVAAFLSRSVHSCTSYTLSCFTISLYVPSLLMTEGHRDIHRLASGTAVRRLVCQLH